MPKHSYVGIGFGDVMLHTNMIVFTSGPDAPNGSKGRNCYGL